MHAHTDLQVCSSVCVCLWVVGNMTSDKGKPKSNVKSALTLRAKNVL